MQAIANCTGPAQKTVHDFVDVDSPPGFAEPTKTERSALFAQCEEYYFLAKWFLCSEDSPIVKPIRDLTQELSPCDREELRHAIAVDFWRKAVSATYRGVQPTKSAWLVIKMVKRYLQTTGKLSPTVAHVSHDEAKAAKEALAAKRLERLEADHLRIVAQERAEAMSVVASVPVISFQF